MNEQIQELAEQADATVLGTMTGGKQYTFLEHDLEKFVELIVKEYEKLLPDICPWADAAKEGPMKGWHVQFVARKHFGVLE